MYAAIAILGRLCLTLVFLGSALGNHIPKFKTVTEYVRSEGIPLPELMHAGAIAFMLVGGLSVLFGYKARFGALLLLIFLVLAMYWIHDFWTYAEPERTEQQIHFMKNLSMAGAMLLIIAAGSGPGSLDNRPRKPADVPA